MEVELKGTTTIEVNSFMELVNKAELYEKSMPVLQAAFEKSVTQLTMGLIRFLKANNISNIIVREFNSESIIHDIIHNDKIVHIILMSSPERNEIIISAGNKEVE